MKKEHVYGIGTLVVIAILSAVLYDYMLTQKFKKSNVAKTTGIFKYTPAV